MNRPTLFLDTESDPDRVLTLLGARPETPTPALVAAVEAHRPRPIEVASWWGLPSQRAAALRDLARSRPEMIMLGPIGYTGPRWLP